ncbi:baseplate J/gp47 family protein [Fusobacterium necrophorum]|uniref:baseplate J/gp47 family protein n=1 Tax=Fusobacterium necrophorum TaxID=859 RepID=UPI00254E0806|nr:baseplate J/gp47 family protein [Fusobacterium necrophorum]MDK4524489.1 baseplate J/gp47 family protein [Fusobacterium necrophorum]
MIIKKEQKEILNSMLDRVNEEYDRTEGGLFYDNLAPAAIEMAVLYEKLDYIFLNSFAETAQGEYLDNITKEVGVFRKQATKAREVVTIQGIAGTSIPLGTKVASDTFIYLTTEEKTISMNGTVDVPVESEKSGEIYNVPKNAVTLFPVTIPGLNSVTNKSPITDGCNRETDEELRERYYFKVREPVTSGNVYHYKKWALEIEGVGGVKVFPLWAGAGTVKVVIVNNKIETANEELLQKVRNYLEEVRPIGATVTVKSATNKNISITGTAKISRNVDFEEVKKIFEKELKEHLKKVGFKQNYISYAQVGNILLNVQGVNDYDNLRVNNGVVNIQLQEEEIPKLLSINLQKEVV